MTQAFWFKSVVVALLSLLVGGVFAANAIVDPANLFHHDHALNRWKYSFDERLQKTSYLTHRANLDAIETLVFGSSRNTYYDQEFFGQAGVFNYSFSNGHPEEYVTFYNYARDLKGADFERIVIALDFVGYGFDDRNAASNAELIADIQGPVFWLKYLSIDMLENTWRTVVSSIHKKQGLRVYGPDNNTWIDQVDPKEVRAAAVRRSKIYYADMAFDDLAYFGSLRSLQESSSSSEFFVFTNPVSLPFLEVIRSDLELCESYYHWTREIVKIFGKVYFFTWPNDFAREYDTLSKDGDHYYKDTLREIAAIVEERRPPEPNGMLLTQADLANDLAQLRQVFSCDWKQD
jgi:hypothetical protein